MTQKLLSNPGKIISLKYFVDNLGAAKSTISEDLTEIKQNLHESGEGTLQTVSGKNGGIKFIPLQSQETIQANLDQLEAKLKEAHRILPGGYLYMGDIISNPALIKNAAKMFAGYFSPKGPDVVLTVETKGILLAGYTADYLGVPLAIARRNSRVTEGSVLTINYISGSTNMIQTMSLSTRAIEKNSKVLIIDDFMKRGGTLKGLKNLTYEFESNVVGLGVLLEQGTQKEKLVSEHLSLGILENINEEQGQVNLTMRRGDFLKNNFY